MSKTVCVFMALLFAVSWMFGTRTEAQTPFDGLRLAFDRDAPVQIVSERLEFSPEARTLLFTGNVVVSQVGLRISCERLEVQTDTKGAVVHLVAQGAVSLLRDSWRATAGKLIYSREGKTLILEDAPVIEHGSNLIKGRRMVFDIDENRLRVEDANTEVSLPAENAP